MRKWLLAPARAVRHINFLAACAFTAFSLSMVFLALGYLLPRLAPEAAPPGALIRFFSGTESVLTYVALAVIFLTAVAITALYLVHITRKHP